MLTVDINHNTGSGTYTAWTVNVGGVVPATSVTWGSITGTLGDQTDLATALNAKLDSATATTTYAPIASPTFTGVVTIPAGASISGYAPLASPALTGNVTITSNSTGPALFIEQDGTGNILTLHDQATDTNFVAIDANGKVNTIPAEATNGAGFNIAHGVAPTTPVNGDVWTTTSGLFARINATTQQYAALGSNVTFSSASSTFGSSTGAGTINVASGATISASTKTVNVATGGVVGSTTLTTIGPVLGASTTSIGGTTAASTLNLATGATLTATTKAVNIGIGGVAGSTTNITIGSTAGTSTTTLQGITNGVTQTAGDSSLKLATTAFVTTADNLKANLASPTFTGTPAAPTATPGTNTTQIATTAFVLANAPATSFATDAQVVTGTSTTTALAPGNAGFLKADPRLRSLAHISFTRVSGSGAVTSGSVPLGIREMYLGSLATGLAGFSYGWTGQVSVNMSAADWNKVDFSKKIWMSGTAMCGATLGATNYIGDSNTRNRVTLGGYNSDTTSGDMSVKGIGWKKVGGTSPFFTLTVHNGTTLTDVATSVTQTAGKVINWVIYSDGTGNVTLYIDGTQVATTSAGPTGTSNTLQATYREQVEAVATPTVRAIMECSGGWIYLAD